MNKLRLQVAKEIAKDMLKTLPDEVFAELEKAEHAKQKALLDYRLALHKTVEVVSKTGF